MLHVLNRITQGHDLRLVFVAVLLCGFASWTSVTLFSRARVSAGRTRHLWVGAAAMVFGAGVWTTHFISMLAFRSPFPIGYDIGWTALSITSAIALSALGYALVFRPRLALLGGAALGLAIGTMLYFGSLAMHGAFDLRFDASYLGASFVAGLVFGVLAVLAGTRIRNIRGRALAAALISFAVCAMHFTAISAVTFVPDSAPPFDDAVFAPSTLAIAVTAVALLVLVLGLASAHLDRHLALRRTGEEARLRAYIMELESTKIELISALQNAFAAAEAKAAFLAAMSHELRTPLNAVIGFSELMSVEPFGPLGNERYREYADDINRSGTHLLSMINDILDLSRLEAGKASLVEANVAVAHLVDDTLCLVSSRAESAGLKLTTDIPAVLPLLRADERRLRQMLLNLLSNAIKFTPNGGVVTIRVRSLPSLVIEVADTGIGIAPADMARALERFGQVDSRLSRKYEGTGLGLPLAKHLMELHGGSLAIQSQPGVGTTVTLAFPATRTVKEARAAA